MLFAKVPHCFIDDLPKDRPFTRLEAAYQYEVDRFNSKERSMREYAKTWSWSPGKVIRFIAEILQIDSDESLSIPIKNDGTNAEQRRNSNRTVKAFKNNELQTTTEQGRNNGGTVVEHVFIREEKREDYSSFLDAWNEIVAGVLPTVRKPVSKDRQKKCVARMKERSLQEWEEIFRLMTDTPFLCGKGDKGWTATFDWIAKNGDNAGKVIDGKYKNTDGRAGNNDNRYAAIFAGA